MIEKIYWVVHPGFTASGTPKTTGISHAQLKRFIGKRIHPAIEEAVLNQNALLIYVKSGVPDSFDPEEQEGIHRMQKIENELEEHIRGKMDPKRLIVVQGHGVDPIAENVFSELEDRGIRIHYRAQTESFGTYRELCARQFPNALARALQLEGSVNVSHEGTLSREELHQRVQNKRGQVP